MRPGFFSPASGSYRTNDSQDVRTNGWSWWAAQIMSLTEFMPCLARLDRLGRSTIDLLTIVKQIADRGCLFKSLADPWADTTTPAGRLMLTVLGGLAEFERELIKARTTEGRERAKRAGVKMGRKPLLTPHQIAEIRARKAGGESVRFLARSYGVSPNTISRVR